MTTISALIDLARASDDAHEIAVITREVIDSGSTSAMITFARSVPGADIASLQQAVIDSDNAFAAFDFACGVPGADHGDFDRFSSAVTP